MKQVKGYITLGIVLLVVGFALSIVWIAQFASLFNFESDFDSLSTTVFWIYALLLFQMVAYSGGLFFVIFFSIRGHKIDKRAQQK